MPNPLRNPQGHYVEYGSWGDPRPADTLTCAHGPHVIFCEPYAAWEHVCMQCMRPICAHCKKEEWSRPAGLLCSHIERRLEAFERAVSRRSEVERYYADLWMR
jgi:hypothetical protein